MNIAFCVFGIDESVVHRTEFYQQDFAALERLGHTVRFVAHPGGLRRSDDLLYVWWWNYMWLWGPVAWLRGWPVITTGVFDLAAFDALPRWKQLLKRHGTVFPTLHVFVSHHEMETVPARVGIQREHATFSPLAVDVSAYRPGDRAAVTGAFEILNVCWQRKTNIARKMVPELISAFARFARDVSNAKLILAGPPEDGGPILRQMAIELGVAERVVFPGEITRSEKIRLMQTCSLYVQVSKFEGFGVAIAEAMACGAPVLASAVGSVPEVVGDCGTFVDTISEDGIYSGLHRAYGERGPRNMRGVDRVRALFDPQRRSEFLASAISRVV